MKETQFPETLIEAVKYFAEGDIAFNFVVTLRWPNGVCCPRCNSSNVGFVATRKLWECRSCMKKKQFTVKVGTIFEDSALKLDKWLCALWLISNAKNGISSYELHRSLGVTQKTAWFMLHRIRLALKAGSFEKMGGEVEADESFVGSKSVNRHFGKKTTGTGPMDMTAVAGLLERGKDGKPSRVKVRVARSRRKADLQANIRENVTEGAGWVSDALQALKRPS